MKEDNYIKFENTVLGIYNEVRDSLTEDDDILCNYIGKFSQDILISIISLTEHALVQNSEPKKIRNRLLYVIVETVQNIIHHSDDLPDDSQLTFLLVTNTHEGYQIHATNTILTEKAPALENKINALLKQNMEGLARLFQKKLSAPSIEKEGGAGLGLITLMSRSERNFAYTMSKLSDNYSLFQLKIELKYKDYK